MSSSGSTSPSCSPTGPSSPSPSPRFAISPGAGAGVRLAAIGGVVAYFGALGAGFDALENICLLLTLDGAGAALPLLATIFAACKFILLAVAIAYLVAGLTMRLFGRGPVEQAS